MKDFLSVVIEDSKTGLHPYHQTVALCAIAQALNRVADVWKPLDDVAKHIGRLADVAEKPQKS